VSPEGFFRDISPGMAGVKQEEDGDEVALGLVRFGGCSRVSLAWLIRLVQHCIPSTRLGLLPTAV
jgi:hypothetical protein